MGRHDLITKVSGFAGELQHILNQTVCDGVVLKSVLLGKLVVIGYNIDKDDIEAKRFPLTRSARSRPSCYMGLSYRLGWDDEGEFLRVETSYVGIFADEAGEHCLCHFDYERNKPDGYPEAHIQVHGHNEALEHCGRRPDLDGELEKLHFPVGGRRYRPALEDIIDFLITERLADGHEGWQGAVEDARRDFQQIQLRAAVRRDPETARQVLKSLDAETEQAAAGRQKKLRRGRR